MHAAVCLLRAGEQRLAGKAAKIRSVHRSIHVGHRWPKWPQKVKIYDLKINWHRTMAEFNFHSVLLKRLPDSSVFSLI